MTKMPLSRIQLQFLLNHELHSQSRAYNLDWMMRVDGELDESRLRDAWQRVYRAMPLYRCGVVYEDDQPFFAQVGSATAPWEVVECDEREVQALATAEAERPFDLDAPPLVRFVVYRVSPLRRYLLVVEHHIVTDLFTQKLLAENLSRAYEDPDFVADVVPYTDFVAAEKAFLAGDAGVRAREYWAARMQSDFEPLRLPLASPRRAGFSGTGRRVPWTLSAGLASRLSARESEGEPAFVHLLTGYACLLARLTGQRRFCIGVPFTNRTLVGDRPLPGPTVNILPLVVEIATSDTYSSVYARIRRDMLLNHRRQALPFLEIARLRDGNRDTQRPRLLQSGFTSTPRVHLDISGITTSPVGLARTGSQMDLFFTWWREAHEWTGHWEYNDEAFGPQEIILWQKLFERLLAAGLEHKDLPLERVSLVDDACLRMAVGPQRADTYPLGESLADHLESSYETHAANPALIFRDEIVSYREVGRRAARVANHVRGAGAVRGRVVVMLRRGFSMIYALHGIVLSGNAYVPLGLDWPDERVAGIISDVDPSLILTEECFRDRFSGAGCPVATVEEVLRSDDGSLDVSDFRDGTAPADTLYIMYTSGTTGRPKGVVVPHVGIVNHVWWMQERYTLRPDERCMLKTPYTFDVSVWELFWPFIAGASLVIAEEEDQRDPRGIRDLAARHRVNRMNFVPTLLEAFLETDGLHALKDLTSVHSIGETLPVNLLRRFHHTLPGVQLHNLYGPTEASVSVTDWDCSEADVTRGTVPIGYPMANTQIYIVDEAMQLCPPLVKGEILLGGTCLAAGYWNRDEITRERFIPNPFGEGRLYRTGDWGRYALDGAIECFDRKDTQTKIHGVRIELAEIEAHLTAISGIDGAAVIKGRDHADAECLIAYYTVPSGQTVDPAIVRAALRAQLPAAVVPDHLVEVDSFPVNSNGKLDRSALPDVSPRTHCAPARPSCRLEPREAQVAALWEAQLGTPCVDREQNFFDAGGNSMTLLGLRVSLEKCFGISVSIATLFEHPTIGGMAELFRESGSAPEARTRPQARGAVRRQSLRTMPARRRRDE